MKTTTKAKPKAIDDGAGGKIRWSLFRRTDNKRFVLTVTPEGQKPTQLTAGPEIKTERAAKSWANDKLLGITANGGKIPDRKEDNSPSLRSVHEELMRVREKMPNLKASTLSNNWTHLRAQILDRKVNVAPRGEDDFDIADVPMGRVDIQRARRFVRAVRARVSPSHCRNVVLSTLRPLWDVAIGENKRYATSNPWREALVIDELPKQRAVKRLDDDPDPIAIPLPLVQALLELEGEPLRHRVKAVIGVCQGFDDGEIQGLQFRHVRELAALGPVPPDAIPYFAVRQQVAMRGKDGYATVDTPKTDNRLRDVPMHPAAVGAVEAWIEEWERLMCRKPRPTDFLFPNAKGEPSRPLSAALLRAGLGKANARALGATGRALVAADHLALIDFKACRRTFSSALKACNVDEEDRGKLMGHSGSTVTARNYTRHQLANLREKVGRIPITWPPLVRLVRGLVHTSEVLAQGAGPGILFSGVMSEPSTEARIGFEPTYDGFAKRPGAAAVRQDSGVSQGKHHESDSPADGHPMGREGDFAEQDTPAQGPSSDPHKDSLEGRPPGEPTSSEGRPGVARATRLRVHLDQTAVAPLRGGLAGGRRR